MHLFKWCHLIFSSIYIVFKSTLYCMVSEFISSIEEGEIVQATDKEYDKSFSCPCHNFIPLLELSKTAIYATSY